MTAYSKQIIVFSLNGTLSPNDRSMDEETSTLLSSLLSNKKVAIISGCDFRRFETQLLKSFGNDVTNFTNLYLLPVSGTKLMSWKGAWVEVYSEHISQKHKEEIMTALHGSLGRVGWIEPQRSFGPIVQDRGSQITFSGLGENAPLEAKSSWDPDRKLREKIVSDLSSKIPNYDIRIGGLTSIDITSRGVNKGYGIRKLEEMFKAQPETFIFVGDSIYPGGNDYPVKATGVDCVPVKTASETKELLKSWTVM